MFLGLVILIVMVCMVVVSGLTVVLRLVSGFWRLCSLGACRFWWCGFGGLRFLSLLGLTCD